MDTSGQGTGTAGRDIGTCPVMHGDFSRVREAGSHWQWAGELREGSPLYFNTFAPGYWVFTRHDAVRDIYRNAEIFSSESITPWEPEPIYRFVPTQIDPPDHVKYRRIVNVWFSPRRVDSAEPVMRRICRSLVEQVAPQGGCDFVAEFALRYPTEVFLSFIGLDTSLAGQFVGWVEDFFRGFGGDPAGLAPMAAALESIREYWVNAIEERHADPVPRVGDLASYLLQSTVDGRPVTDAEILDILTVLVLAGLDTTRGQLGYMFRHLATNPGDRQALAANPELIPSAVEEVLRFYTIIFGDGRKVTRDTEFYGADLKQGDMVYGLVSAANRDPRVYDRADEFIIDRKRNRHFGFAGGPHRCLGAHLARREMAVAAEEWLRVIPDFRIATDASLTERGGGSMMTLMNFPMAWEVAQ